MSQINEHLTAALNSKADLSSSSLPNIDLYMDQVITLLGRGADKEDAAVTKTMINNYRKADIIKPLNGKKYSPEHLIELLLTLQLKNVLSLNEIKQMMPELYQQDDGDEKLRQTYDRFLDAVPAVQTEAERVLKSILPQEAEQYDALYALLILSRIQDYVSEVSSRIIKAEFPEKTKEKKK